MTSTDAPIYVLMKRGYFYRPNAAGYTAQIQEAGRYTADECKLHVCGGDEPVTMHLAATFAEIPPGGRFAKKHAGMKANGARYLRDPIGRGFTFMRRQMADHLEEMAVRFYSGDVSAVDEFLQLYCFGEKEREHAISNLHPKPADEIASAG